MEKSRIKVRTCLIGPPRPLLDNPANENIKFRRTEWLPVRPFWQAEYTTFIAQSALTPQAPSPALSEGELERIRALVLDLSLPDRREQVRNN